MKFKTHENKLHWNKINYKIKHNYKMYKFKYKYIYVIEQIYLFRALFFLNYNLIFYFNILYL